MAARAAKKLLRTEIKQAVKKLNDAEKERQSQIVISKVMFDDDVRFYHFNVINSTNTSLKLGENRISTGFWLAD